MMKPGKINWVKETSVVGDISQRNGTKIVCRHELLMGKYVWMCSPSRLKWWRSLMNLPEMKNNNWREYRDSVFIFSTKPCLKIHSLGKTPRWEWMSFPEHNVSLSSKALLISLIFVDAELKNTLLYKSWCVRREVIRHFWNCIQSAKRDEWRSYIQRPERSYIQSGSGPWCWKLFCFAWQHYHMWTILPKVITFLISQGTQALLFLIFKPALLFNGFPLMTFICNGERH